MGNLGPGEGLAGQAIQQHAIKQEMCWIIGFIGGGQRPAATLRATGAAMAASIAHRGPDHQGVWTEASVPLVLGYRRLAIQDLSSAGT